MVLMSEYATLKDVAKLAGTTAATVSYVLNEKEGRYISEEMRSRVLKAAEELDYIKSIGASNLRGRDRRLVGLLVPQFENQFFTRIAIACEGVFVQHGYDLMICNTFDSPEREKDILKRMLEQRVDGILITPSKEGRANTERLRRVGMNMVVIDRSLPGVEGYNRVSTDNYLCGAAGAGHIFEKGHRKVAYIGWNSGLPDMDSRTRAVLDTAESFGLGRDDVVVENGEFNAEDGYRLTARVLDRHPECTAVFYGFNVQAKGGVNCLRDRGIRIPEDISVVLIGSPEWADTGYNNFTHVDMAEQEMGRKAAELLLKHIQGRAEPSGFEHIIQECSLVEGSSVLDKNY